MTIEHFLTTYGGYIITFAIQMIALVAAWQKMSDKISFIEEKIITHERVHAILDSKIEGINTVDVKLAQIQTDILWIKQRLNERNTKGEKTLKDYLD